MFKQIPRWGWLTILALCNLLVWLSLALGLGLMASDEVDLGVETLARHYRATAVVAWQQAAWRTSATPERRLASTVTPKATRGGAVARAEGAANTPTAIIVWPDTATPERTPATPTPPGAVGRAAPEQVASTAGATPEPALVPLKSPLLMADPELKDLAHIDAEMNRSAIGRPVQIRYQEVALNQEIEALLRNNPDLPYDHVQIDLKRDQVMVRGNAMVLGVPISAQIGCTVIAQDCLPQVRIQTISLAGILTPRFVQDQIKDMLLQAMTWYPADYALCIEFVVLEEDRATVYGSRR